ncbi:hypothetical protein Avbf_10230 [Armadillidium vulgare]|nr:hypothetical protein Avbf_10230 [Armadillidium vulgare]
MCGGERTEGVFPLRSLRFSFAL